MYLLTRTFTTNLKYQEFLKTLKYFFYGTFRIDFAAGRRYYR